MQGVFLNWYVYLHKGLFIFRWIYGGFSIVPTYKDETSETKTNIKQNRFQHFISISIISSSTQSHLISSHFISSHLLLFTFWAWLLISSFESEDKRKKKEEEDKQYNKIHLHRQQQ